MFDFWGNDGIIYPRPYDMDTQMGLSNTGYDVISVGAELFTNETSGDLKDFELIYDGASTDQVNKNRLADYNSSNSRLWHFISAYYNNEIKNTYHKLRDNGVYTVEQISANAEALTSKYFSETLYNEDGNLKYLTQGIGYYSRISGNRNDRYRQFLRDRLKFLDSVFNYGEMYS
jgi:hypothetical protein